GGGCTGRCVASSAWLSGSGRSGGRPRRLCRTQRARFLRSRRRHCSPSSRGQGSAAMLVAEVFVRRFENQRHLSSFLGLAPTPHASGEISRNKGISKAGCKLARSTLVELAWSWLRYQHDSALATWWRSRFSKTRNARAKHRDRRLGQKARCAFWQFVEDGQV